MENSTVDSYMEAVRQNYTTNNLAKLKEDMDILKRFFQYERLSTNPEVKETYEDIKDLMRVDFHILTARWNELHGVDPAEELAQAKRLEEMVLTPWC